MDSENDSLIHLRVPRELKGRWVARSQAVGMKLGDWIVQRVGAADATPAKAAGVNEVSPDGDAKMTRYPQD